MLEYMGLQPGTPIQKIAVDRVFIGSCTNSRLEDLRAAARVARGYRVNPKVRAMVVPGSQAVKREAEQEGLDKIFRETGFEWRGVGRVVWSWRDTAVFWARSPVRSNPHSTIFRDRN